MNPSFNCRDESDVQLDSSSFRAGSHITTNFVEQTKLKPSDVCVDHDRNGHANSTPDGKVPRPLAAGNAFQPHTASSAFSFIDDGKVPRPLAASPALGTLAQDQAQISKRCGRCKYVGGPGFVYCVICKHVEGRQLELRLVDKKDVRVCVNLHQAASSLNGVNGEATNSDDVNVNDERKRMFKESRSRKYAKIADGKHRKPKKAQVDKPVREPVLPTKTTPASVDSSLQPDTACAPPTTPGNGDSAGCTINPFHAGTVLPNSDATLDSAETKQDVSLPRPAGVSAPPIAPLVTRKLYYTMPKQSSIIPIIVLVLLIGAVLVVVFTPGIFVIPVFLTFSFLVFLLYRFVPVYRAARDIYRFLISSIPEVETFGYIDATMYNTADDAFSPATGQLRYHYGRDFNAYRVVDISKEMYDFLCFRHPNAQPRVHTIQVLMATLTTEFRDRSDIPRDIAQNTADVYFQDMIRLEEQRMLLGARRTIQIV